MLADGTAAGPNRDARLRVLVTRPSADAIPLAGELQRRGFDVLLQPLLRVELEEGPAPDLAGVQALLFTSANGVRAFARRSAARMPPVFAVGDATAAAARAEGFSAVASAGGDVDDLAALVRQRLDPGGGRLLHIAGSAVAGDLSGDLASSGFQVDRAVLYHARRTESLDPAIHSALAAGAVDAAMFFSPRSAAGFVSLVRDAALTEACAGMRAYCLSDAVAEALSAVAWKAVVVASAPTQDSLLATLERDVTESSEPAAAAAPETDQPENANDLLAAGDAVTVVDRFGGIRPMAAKLGIPVTTVQGWRGRGHIPANRIDEIRRAAAQHGVDLSPAADAPARRPEAPTPPTGAEAPARDGHPPPETGSAAPGTSAPGPAAGGGRWVAWAAVLLAVVALAAVASYPYWGPVGRLQPAVPDAVLARIGELETAMAAEQRVAARVGQLESKSDALAREVAALPKADADGGKAVAGLTSEIASLRMSVDTLTRRITQLEDRSTSSETATQETVQSLRRAVDGIEGRLKAIETRPPATGGRIATLAVAVGQLESAVDAGRPYTGPFDGLKAMIAGDTALEQALGELAPAADAGVPTLADLERQFTAIAPKLTMPGAAESDGGWTETLRRKALSLINMRPVGESGDASPVTRAERALARGDLAGAVAALDGVDGLADAWRARARQRLDADAALAALRQRVVERLAAESAADAERTTP